MKKTASGQTDEKLTANEAGGQDRNERKLFSCDSKEGTCLW